jgi:hypothetical protein
LPISTLCSLDVGQHALSHFPEAIEWWRHYPAEYVLPSLGSPNLFDGLQILPSIILAYIHQMSFFLSNVWS